MSTKHTPGPWVTEKSGSVIWIGTPRSNGQKVDEIVTHIEIDLTYKTEVIEKKLANAKLIAAAPEMLADLQAIQNIMEDSGRAGCKYGETDFDSLSVVHGYNLALQHVKSHITSIAKATQP